MSSSVTGDLVHGSKLLVHSAENGHSFEIDCDESTPVEAVQRFIESVSCIHPNDQLLLCMDMKLDSQSTLSEYKLPSNDREVFLFNKVRLQTNSPPPAPEDVDIVEIADPPLPSSSHNPHPLDDATDPALKALPSYERQFRYHYHRGHAIYSRTQAKFENCQRLLREAKVQERAAEVGRANLEQYYKIVNQNYMDFMRRYFQQHRYHADLLANFGRDMERLKSCKLHPSLQTATRKCLLDFVKEENLRKWLESCSSSHKQFDSKISQFKQMFSDVKRKVEDLLSSKASLPVRNIELMIKEHMRHIDEQKSIMQSLSKDVSTVKKLVDDCLTSQLSSSLRPHDAVSALGPMYDVHDKNHLPKMQAFDRSISKLLDFCKDKKNEMNMFLHHYMQNIAYMSYVIKDAKLQFHVFKEAIRRQDDLFVNLKLTRGIGPAYRACLAEVVRRKATMKLYMGMAGQLAEKLATKRELEVRRREEFLKTHGEYIPRDILASMGLYDTPNQCDVNIVPFDANLLDIDIPDLDRFAPEYLAGLPSKSERHGTSGSFSMSNDSSHSAEVEENPVDTQKYDSEEPLDCCELVEIAGTSKVEVENAKLKAELASAIALICSFGADVEYESIDDSRLDALMKNAGEKTAEALRLKDEYEKHLQSLLSAKQLQCVSYEKRIQELEQRLSDQYLQGQKLSGNEGETLGLKVDDCKSEISGDGEARMPYISTTEPMDEVSYASCSLDGKLALFPKQLGKAREGVDESMLDSSGVLNPQFDSLVPEQQHGELKVVNSEKIDEMVGQVGMIATNSFTAESMSEPLNNLPCDKAVEPDSDDKISADHVLELQTVLEEKSNQLSEAETNLKAAMEEVAMLGRELEIRRKLLHESQMNCAHLENCLHEAREEAQTHLCAADRRASEYSALRASAVKMRGLFERLRSCVTSAGVAVLADSLRAMAQSLANSSSDNEDDGMAEFRTCIQVLADKVGFLSKHRTELLDRFSKAEAANKLLMKELEEKKEMVKTLYTKHQLEKQASKEKISFRRFEVHEIAAFVLNRAGYYEAINRNCSNYYLSTESVALFTDHLPDRPNHIIGQIVHIERQSVKPPPNAIRLEHNRGDRLDPLTSDAVTNRLSMNTGPTSNPYGLPIGCEYFVVTVAMLPDTSIHSPPPS
ncbi:autophagy-related protein 11 isoform X2 [Malania oleifera]|uniref:autophagy-related protein 11 isoform X2 n=1 Tax=Malania oleifera TaxID=397392 RepID=UPI0025ADBAF4|nr:autophagy-related protein 11 isoform X2 [Malania oleifera]XP_057968551.1 autophagy-related protein 11 isoform X2 [Malania oleifera]